MQVSNGDIWQARESMEVLLKEPWPVKTAYWLAKMARELRGHYADIDQVRTKLIIQYGIKNEKDQVAITPDSPQWPEFVTAYNELMSETVEIAANKITLPEREEVQLTPAVLMDLDPFVDVAA